MVTETLATTNAHDDALHWEVRPGEKDPKKRGVILIVAAFAGALAALISMNWLMAIVAISVILASTTEMFFPIRFSVDRNGATSRCGMSVVQIEWDKVKRVIETNDGIKLSPFDSPSRLEAFRGVYLRFAGNRDEILAKLREFRGGI